MIYDALGGYDAVKNSKMNLNDAANIAGALGFETRSQPSSLAPTLVTLPSMSRVPRAPFTKTESSASLDRLAKRLAASRRKVRPCEPLDITGRVERQRSA